MGEKSNMLAMERMEEKSNMLAMEESEKSLKGGRIKLLKNFVLKDYRKIGLK